jgi:hypothetical protein
MWRFRLASLSALSQGDHDHSRPEMPAHVALTLLIRASEHQKRVGPMGFLTGDMRYSTMRLSPEWGIRGTARGTLGHARTVGPRGMRSAGPKLGGPSKRLAFSGYGRCHSRCHSDIVTPPFQFPNRPTGDHGPGAADSCDGAG